MDLFRPFQVFPGSPNVTEIETNPAQPEPPPKRKRGRPSKNVPKPPPALPKQKPGRPLKDKALEKEKRWIIIFTCRKIRAIHCEYLYDQTEESVLMALEKFCLARGTPKTIYCNRGKYFIGAEDTLRRHWNMLNKRDPCLRELFADIEFYFNPAYAPNYEGHYERLIGVIKEQWSRCSEPPA
jgi:hypothetical protein